MDPLSLAASVIAVVGLADRLTVLVRAFRQAGKAAPSELTELSTEIATLRLILQRLQETDVASTKDRKPSATNDIQVTLQNCDDAIRAARRKVREVERLLRGGALDKVTFAFSSSSFRQDFRDLLGRLERSKTSLLLSLQLINMDGWKVALEAASQAPTIGNSPLPSIPSSGTTLCDDTDSDGEADKQPDSASPAAAQSYQHQPSGPSSGQGASGPSSELTTHASIGGWLSSFRPKTAS